MKQAAAALACASLLLLTACTRPEAGAAEPSEAPTQSAVTKPTHIILGVSAPPEQIEVFQALAEQFQEEYAANVEVSVVAWDSAADLADDIILNHDFAPVQSQHPQIFLTDTEQLPRLVVTHSIHSVDVAMTAREVDLGDGYARSAIEAFSSGSSLQCMPYGADERVVYYNTGLLDFAAIAADGGDVPNEETGAWGWSRLLTAIDFVRAEHPDAYALYAEPSLSWLAPFLYSGGGAPYDAEYGDGQAVTSTAFDDESSRAALARLIPLFQQPGVVATPDDLSTGQTARDLFAEGRLAMYVGTRADVPSLRETAVPWDVLPLPRVDGAATVGSYTGLCLTAGVTGLQGLAAADFMAYLVSAESMEQAARTGTLIPVNTEASLSPEFLQPLLRPAHAQYYASQLRYLRVLPVTAETADAVDAAQSGLLRTLLSMPVDEEGQIDGDLLGLRTRSLDLLSQSTIESLGSASGPGSSALR